jgi:uncharacterized membrane protein
MNLPFSLVALFLILGVSCTKDKTIAPSCNEEVSYSQDVVPIIMNSCAVSGCHTSSSAANGIVLETYEQLFVLREDVLKTVRHEAGVTAMPIGSDQLAAEQIQKMACWIEQGALDN